jgi:hypothetical protein
MKTVGSRPTSNDAAFLMPAEAVARAQILQAEAERLNPYPRPRGFVFKARTWEEYALWRRSQDNPRLW